jgi:DNA-binding CsgD family transcriptional regulator
MHEPVYQSTVYQSPVATETTAALSPREMQVLDMASLGLTNGQIALRLHVSVHAVKFHLAAVYRKLGVANRTEAAFLYLRGSSAAVQGAQD